MATAPGSGPRHFAFGADGRHAYALLFAREPEAEELAIAREFLQLPATETGPNAWEQLAQALLATNEMLYVD